MHLRRLRTAGAPGRPWARPQASGLRFSSEDLACGGRGEWGPSLSPSLQVGQALGGLKVGGNLLRSCRSYKEEGSPERPPPPISGV